jgi:hypothetical protein
MRDQPPSKSRETQEAEMRVGAIFAAVVGAALLAGCEEPAVGGADVSATAASASATQPSSASIAPSIDSPVAARPGVVAASVPESQSSPAPAPALQRTAFYRDYTLVAVSGPPVSASEFETKIMCKDVWQAAEANIWMLQHLVVTGTDSDMTSFLAKSNGRPAEVTLISDISGGHRVASMLMMNGHLIASCS